MRNNRFLYTFITEFRRMFSDSAVWVSVFLISLVVALGYSYVYSNEVPTDVPIAVVDECRTAESRQLSRMIDATEQVAVSHQPTDFEEAKELFYRGKVHGIVVIPKDFSQKLFQKQRPAVSGYYDTAYFLYYKQVYKAVATSLGYMNAGIELKGLTAKGMSVSQAQNTMQVVQSKVVTLFNPNGGYATFAMPMVYLIIIQTLLLMGIGLLGGTAREQQEFSKAGLNIRSLKDVLTILVAKASAYTLSAYFYITIVLFVVMPLFSIPQRGNYAEIYLFLLPLFLAISFMGLSLIRFFRHREDAVMSITFTSIPAMLLAGISWPVEALPEPLQWLAQILPSTHAIKGFLAMSQSGLSLINIQDSYLKLWGVCGLFFVLAVWMFYRMLFKKPPTPKGSISNLYNMD